MAKQKDTKSCKCIENHFVNGIRFYFAIRDFDDKRKKSQKPEVCPLPGFSVNEEKYHDYHDDRRQISRKYHAIF